MDIINPPQLTKVVDYIRNNVDVQCIICYGQRFSNEYAEGCFLRAHQENLSYVFDTLVVISNYEKRSYREIAEVIAKGNTSENVSITTILVRANLLDTLLSEGNFFFNNVLYSGCELFYTGKRYYVDALVFEQVWLKWKRTIEKEKGNAFEVPLESLRSGEVLLGEKSHNKSTLLYFRQTVQLACKSIITWLLGHNVDAVNDIQELLAIINTISTRPGLVFPQDTEEEQSLFQLLNDYQLDIPARMQPQKLDTRRLLILHTRTKKFISVCEDVFNTYIKSIP